MTGGDEAATLVVAWRSPRRIHGRVVRAGESVIGELLSYAHECLAIIDAGGGRAYSPDDDQDDAPFLCVEVGELLDTSILEMLGTAASLPTIDSADLRRRSLAFYALVVGDDPDKRTAFIKRGTAVKLADKGLVTIFDDSLRRVLSPVLAFSPTFDVVASGTGTWALDQKNFEAIFKDTDTVLARTSDWVDALAAQIPIAEGSKGLLAQRLRDNSVLRRKVQSILRSPHFARLTASELQDTMKIRGMDPAEFMPNGEIVFTRANAQSILELLNEDLFTGDFSGQTYAARRKSRSGTRVHASSRTASRR